MKAELLKSIYLFKDMTTSDLEQINSICVEKPYTSGEELFFSGQKADKLYILEQGSVKIFATTENADEVAITTLASGMHFGEMAFFTNDARSATAQTLEPSTVIEISYSSLASLLENNLELSNKFHKSVARFLAGRLRDTTTNLKLAKESKLRHL